jgi:serine/threonine protein kinase
MSPSGLILEHTNLGDLAHRLRTVGLKWSFKISVIRQVAQAIEHIHQFGVVHGGIQGKNVYLHTSGDGLVAKLANFSSSAFLSSASPLEEPFSLLPSPGWMAPESVRDRVFTPNSDVYSFGMLVWEVMTDAKEEPFGYCRSDAELIDEIVTGAKRPPIPVLEEEGGEGEGEREKIPSTVVQHRFRELVERCWARDHSLRPSASSLVKMLESMG